MQLLLNMNTAIQLLSSIETGAEILFRESNTQFLHFSEQSCFMNAEFLRRRQAVIGVPLQGGVYGLSVEQVPCCFHPG